MYSKEERIKAIKLYIKYEKSAADVIHELGYPSPSMLSKWYKAYLQELETGEVWEGYTRKSAFTPEQKAIAVDHYLEYGRSFSRTVRALGYPSRKTLRKWCDELRPGARKRRIGSVKYSQHEKEQVVISLYARDGSAKEIADKYGVKRETLYNWKTDLVGKGATVIMPKPGEENESSKKNKADLLLEIKTLQRQIRKLRLEKDILERTVEIVKKDPGINPKNLANKEKTILIDALRGQIPVSRVASKSMVGQEQLFLSSEDFVHTGQISPSVAVSEENIR